MATMKRTQLYLPEEVLAKLKVKATAQKRSLAQLVRDALGASLKEKEPEDWRRDSLWNMIGCGSSKEGDLSAYHDKYLYGKK